MSRICRIRRAAACLLLLPAAGACGVEKDIAGLFRSDSPYEQYLHTIQKAGLDSTGLGKDWAAAGEQAMARPVPARLPFRETGYFAPHQPGAVVYQFELRRGRRLAIDVSFNTARPARLFMDLFRLRDDQPPQRVASLAAGDSSLTFEVRHDGTYLLRLQPELLRGGRWTVEQRTEASLGFPVPGFGIPAIRSRFGVDRDAGRRRHQGVDIFAPRGTPVVAVVEGLARATTNELGGNVVWLRDGAGGRTLYYAHLDRWAVDGDANVKIGDTLGYVGKTGNARTTPPHLHFGIYEGGPVDPEPFLAPDDPAPPGVVAPVDGFDDWVRVTTPSAQLRRGPHRGADSVRRLDRGWLARVNGASQGAFRVVLPDETVGYLDAAVVTRAGRGSRQARLDSGAVLYEAPDTAAPAVEVLSSVTGAEVLGRFGGFELVRLSDARVGWVAITTTSGWPSR